VVVVAILVIATAVCRSDPQPVSALAAAERLDEIAEWSSAANKRAMILFMLPADHGANWIKATSQC
jgi:hypothetical protein